MSCTAVFETYNSVFVSQRVTVAQWDVFPAFFDILGTVCVLQGEGKA